MRRIAILMLFVLSCAAEKKVDAGSTLVDEETMMSYDARCGGATSTNPYQTPDYRNGSTPMPIWWSQYDSGVFTPPAYDAGRHPCQIAFVPIEYPGYLCLEEVCIGECAGCGNALICIPDRRDPAPMR